MTWSFGLMNHPFFSVLWHGSRKQSQHSLLRIAEVLWAGLQPKLYVCSEVTQGQESVPETAAIPPWTFIMSQLWDHPDSEGHKALNHLEIHLFFPWLDTLTLVPYFAAVPLVPESPQAGWELTGLNRVAPNACFVPWHLPSVRNWSSA